MADGSSMFGGLNKNAGTYSLCFCVCVFQTVFFLLMSGSSPYSLERLLLTLNASVEALFDDRLSFVRRSKWEQPSACQCGQFILLYLFTQWPINLLTNLSIYLSIWSTVSRRQPEGTYKYNYFFPFSWPDMHICAKEGCDSNFINLEIMMQCFTIKDKRQFWIHKQKFKIKNINYIRNRSAVD